MPKGSPAKKKATGGRGRKRVARDRPKLNKNKPEGTPDVLINPSIPRVLDNRELLTKILTEVETVKDLKNIRLVSKSWTDETLNHWRNTAVMVINDETEEILRKAYSAPEECSNTVPECSSKPSSDPAASENDPFGLRDKPFKNFRFSKSKYFTERMFEEKHHQETGEGLKPHYLDNILPQAEFLNIGALEIFWESRYLGGVKWILKKCPQLNLLEVEFKESVNGYLFMLLDDILPVDPDENLIAANVKALRIWTSNDLKFDTRKREIVRFDVYCASRIIKMMPNIESLELKTDDCNSALLAMLCSAEQPELNWPLVKLKSLELPDSFNAPNLLIEYIEKLNAPLEILKLGLPSSYCIKSTTPSSSMEGNSEEECALHVILKACQSTLKKLELEINFMDFKNVLLKSNVTGTAAIKQWIRTPQKINFPLYDFPELKELTVMLQHRYGVFPTLDCNILRGMPKLREFEFGTDDVVEEGYVANKVEVNRLLKKAPPKLIEGVNGEVEEEADLILPHLQTFTYFGCIIPPSIRFLGNAMPNLKKLGVIVDNDNFLTILKTWPRLELLNLLPCSKVLVKSTDLDGANQEMEINDMAACFEWAAVDSEANFEDNDFI